MSLMLPYAKLPTRSGEEPFIKKASGYDAEAHITSETDAAPGRVNHSTAGAIHAIDTLGLPGRILAYLVAGHHAGLPDWEKLESGTGGSLRERLQRTELLDAALAARIPNEILEARQPRLEIPGGRAGFALWVRMLFSCLVDADFLDTEAFMDGKKAGQRSAWPELATFAARHGERSEGG